MKPEPLKDKEKFTPEFEDCGGYYNNEDILSAVKWLKTKRMLSYHDENYPAGIFIVEWQDIREAFQDVIKMG